MDKPLAYAVRNNQGYWVGIWNDRETAEQVVAKGQPSHGERVVPVADFTPDAGQVVVPEFTIDQFNRAAIIVGTMDGYEGASPAADHFNWLNALLRTAGSRHE